MIAVNMNQSAPDFIKVDSLSAEL